MVKLGIISGSVRPGRFNDQVVQFVAEVAKTVEGAAFEVIDLAALNLPFLDEAVPPSQHQYAHAHTKAWAEKIAGLDGFIMVTPEYNHSYSPVLKNAIDYLFSEWNYKPVAFVSYGSLAGGARAVEHLRGVAGELKMYDLREQVLLPNYWENLDASGAYQFTERHKKSVQEQLASLVFWAGAMRTARAELG